MTEGCWNAEAAGRLKGTKRLIAVVGHPQALEAVRLSRNVVDGRLQRRNRTRLRIVEAYLGLCQHAQVPLLRKVAEVAGCSMRTVFDHFADEPALYRAALELAHARLGSRAPFDHDDGSRSARIRGYVAAQARNCADLLPLRMLLSRRIGQPSHGDPHTVALRRSIRDQLERAFGPELSDLRRQEREQLLIALELLTNVESWHLLREFGGLGVKAAKAAWIDAIDRLLPGRLED